MRYRSGFVLILAVLALTVAAMGSHESAVAKPAPSPSPSPTTPPTPYMAPDEATNGLWDVILQGTEISYSVMKLKDDGTNVTGVWLYSKKTVYEIAGTRDGTHLTLTLKNQANPPATVGAIDATIDGIADMVGTITLNGVDTPFQGAQHARVPPPPESTPGPQPSETPY